MWHGIIFIFGKRKIWIPCVYLKLRYSSVLSSMKAWIWLDNRVGRVKVRVECIIIEWARECDPILLQGAFQVAKRVWGHTPLNCHSLCPRYMCLYGRGILFLILFRYFHASSTISNCMYGIHTLWKIHQHQTKTETLVQFGNSIHSNLFHTCILFGHMYRYNPPLLGISFRHVWVIPHSPTHTITILQF